MTASEARDIANKLNREADYADYGSVIKAIEYAAQKGYYELYWSKAVRKNTVEALRKDGYTVKLFSDQRDGDGARISW